MRTEVRGAPARSLDDVIPVPHFSERHERHIAAPPEAVWDALFAVRSSDLPLTRALMAVRTLPERVGRPQRPAVSPGVSLHDAPVPVLTVHQPLEVLAGGVLQPWKLRGGGQPPALDATALGAFQAPGWVRCGVDFILEPDGAGTVLRTETRVHATDAVTRARFAVYWLAIRAGSGLIRREILRSVARRAEASSGG